MIFKYDPPKEFEREGHLRNHQKSKSCVNNCNVFCNNCGTGFKTPESLAGHLKHFNCPKRYKCDSCDNYFKLEKELMAHFESKHS